MALSTSRKSGSATFLNRNTLPAGILDLAYYSHSMTDLYFSYTKQHVALDNRFKAINIGASVRGLVGILMCADAQDGKSEELEWIENNLETYLEMTRSDSVISCKAAFHSHL